MTNPQTEARAIALAAAGQVHDNEDARCVETLVEKLVTTALAAKDAELAEVKEMYAREGAKALYELERAERAEAQLAEANKALEAYEAALEEAEAIFGGEYADAYGPMFELALAARRTREAQGGNNG